MQNNIYAHPVIREDMLNIAKAPADWERIRDKTILITGAGGLIGYYLCAAILHLNIASGLNSKVVALVRNGEKARKRFGEICDRADFELCVQDVSEPLEYKGKIDFIIHAASQASPKYFISDPVGTIEANTDGTKNMLNAAVDNKAELLYLSTREIYGSGENSGFIAENDYGAIDPTLVRSCYPESKRIAETLCAAYSHQHGVIARVARIAHTYGPDFELDNGRVWGDFVTAVVNNRNIILKSEGLMRLSFSYISDIVSGLFLILLNGSDFVYNAANMQEIVSIRSLAITVAGLFPDRGISVEIKLPENAQGYLANEVGFLDSGKLAGLGWKPKIDVKEGFRRTILFHINGEK